MGELKKITTYLIDNFKLILLLVYSVSFANYYIFYKSFNISIFNYVGLSDLIFFTLEYVFKILLIIVLYELIFFLIFTTFWIIYEKIVLIKKKKLKLFLKSNNRNKERIRNVFYKFFSTSLTNAKFIIMILGIFVLIYLPFKLITIPTYFVYFIYLTELISKENMSRFSVTFSSIIIVLSMIFTTLYNSYSKRSEKENYTISFTEENKLITTEKGKSSLNYLGETSTSIFLYDIKSKKAKIYNKSSISGFEIQNSNTIDEFIILIKESYPARMFMEMINEKTKQAQ